MRISVKLSDLNFKKKHNEQIAKFNLNNNSEIMEKSKDFISGEEELENEENEKEDEEESTNDNFIQLQKDYEENKYFKKINLVEYDLFYKEQFFKNDVFKCDFDNLKDKEVEKINKEIKKSDIKAKIIEKKK